MIILKFLLRILNIFMILKTALSKSAGSNINTPIIVSEKILAKNKDKTNF